MQDWGRSYPPPIQSNNALTLGRPFGYKAPSTRILAHPVDLTRLLWGSPKPPLHQWYGVQAKAHPQSLLGNTSALLPRANASMSVMPEFRLGCVPMLHTTHTHARAQTHISLPHNIHTHTHARTWTTRCKLILCKSSLCHTHSRIRFPYLRFRCAHPNNVQSHSLAHAYQASTYVCRPSTQGRPGDYANTTYTTFLRQKRNITVRSPLQRTCGYSCCSPAGAWSAQHAPTSLRRRAVLRSGPPTPW